MLFCNDRFLLRNIILDTTVEIRVAVFVMLSVGVVGWVWGGGCSTHFTLRLVKLDFSLTCNMRRSNSFAGKKRKT